MNYEIKKIFSSADKSKLYINWIKALDYLIDIFSKLDLKIYNIFQIILPNYINNKIPIKIKLYLKIYKIINLPNNNTDYLEYPILNSVTILNNGSQKYIR